MAKNNRRAKRSGSGFFLGLICGMAIGAMLALLFAPQSGEETRAQLAAQSDNPNMAGLGSIDTIVQQVRSRYNEAFAQGRDAYERAKEEVLARYNQARS